MYAEQDAKTGMPVRERGELGVPLGTGPLWGRGRRARGYSSNSCGRINLPAWLLNEDSLGPFTELGLLATAGETQILHI